jgi:ATP-dependent DNA helicase RecG
MNTYEIRSLIAHGESETVEFKTSTAQLKRAFETICAFLNGSGGCVFIGVNDEGKLVGQQITDKTKQEIAIELGKLEPTPQIEIHYTPLQEEKATFIILLQIPKGLRAPYLYDGRAYQRHQSTTVRMPQQHYEHLLMSRAPVRYSWA